MCGLTGFWDMTAARDASAQRAIVRRMARTMTARGPDDSGEWVDPAAGIALGFRRLAIVDLSPAGHQPMESASGRYWMVFNGEVYNFESIRRELQVQGLAPAFRGHSDTEVMLAAIEAWGPEAAVKRFVGMFAVALWDRQERVLHLVRDRLGIKPLYYGWAGNCFLFGSELKPLRAHPDFCAQVDPNSLALMLRHCYVPTPYSIYQGFYKLPPGTILTLQTGGVLLPAPVPYWSARAVAEAGLADPFRGAEAEAVERLDALLREAVSLRMIADVPLGAFLSGGVDSSTVVALMQVQSSQAVKTFSIGFHEDSYNEAQHAKAVAKHLHTDHTELYLSADEAMSVIPRLPTMYDEPFADSSQIPTYLVSEMARRRVTVSLSGDGGDELFAGYTRYIWSKVFWKKFGWVPPRLRRMSASMINSVSPIIWDEVYRKAAPILPKTLRQNHLGDKAIKFAELLSESSQETLYRLLVSHLDRPADVVRNACEPPTVLTSPEQWANIPDFTSWMMFMDTVTYLPDDILTKVDRASMGVSLEARVPLLDHRVVEFAWRLPFSMKMRHGRSKWLLRQVLYQYVPEALIERPKMGFAIPIGAWLRGPLRAWAESLLDTRRLQDQGFFHPEPIRQKWAEHLAGRYNWQYWLWNVLMFQAWLEEQGTAPASCAESPPRPVSNGRQ
jgi:asparagine synthase (glutamine-hydrolysing)